MLAICAESSFPDGEMWEEWDGRRFNIFEAYFAAPSRDVERLRKALQAPLPPERHFVLQVRLLEELYRQRNTSTEALAACAGQANVVVTVFRGLWAQFGELWRHPTIGSVNASYLIAAASALEANGDLDGAADVCELAVSLGLRANDDTDAFARRGRRLAKLRGNDV
jgi:hypothetical protein